MDAHGAGPTSPGPGSAGLDAGSWPRPLLPATTALIHRFIQRRVHHRVCQGSPEKRSRWEVDR